MVGGGAIDVDYHVRWGRQSAEPLRSARLAHPRDAVRFRHGGGRRISPDRHSQLDQPAAVSGSPLALLSGLWLLGRIACLISADLPAWLAIAADLSFPGVLFAVAAREIIAGRNWRNLPMTAPVAVFIARRSADASRIFGFRVPTGLGWRLGVGPDPADLGRRRPDRSELYPQLAGQAPSTRLPAPSWRSIDLRDRRVSRRNDFLGLASRFPSDGRDLLVVGAALNAWRLARWAGIDDWPSRCCSSCMSAMAGWWPASLFSAFRFSISGFRLPLRSMP